MFSVCIQPQDFDVSTELARLHASNAQVGAACFFVGLVRDRWIQVSERHMANGATVILQTDVTEAIRAERQSAHAEAVARAEGYGQVRLYTNQRFAENIHLYRRLGYEVEREETWTGGVIVHMRKPLEG